MTEEDTRLKYWDAVTLLKEYIDDGGGSVEDVIDELENDLVTT